MNFLLMLLIWKILQIKFEELFFVSIVKGYAFHFKLEFIEVINGLRLTVKKEHAMTTIHSKGKRIICICFLIIVDLVEFVPSIR